MPESLYLATNENATGKRMVALGVMELATRRFDRVAFFRPFVQKSAEMDQSIALMRSRYQLDTSPSQMMGMTRAEARQLLAADRYEELIARVQQSFKTIQREADFTVVEGTSFQGLASELEFELNADLAVNLGCEILSVYSAHGKSVNDCVQSIRIGNDSLTDRGGSVLATVVNQVDSDLMDSLASEFDIQKSNNRWPTYLLPEEPLLRQPTLREIQLGLGAAILTGDESTFDREVVQLKVAAMQLPTFLDRLKAGSLVITPGDRSDIVAGCALASMHADTPAPAGMILTGGLEPPESLQRLLRVPSTLQRANQPSSNLPILMTSDDTFTTAKRASMIKAEICMQAPRKIDSAIGLFEKHIDVDELADRLKAPSTARVTPLLFEYSLIQNARSQRTRIVLPEGNEPRILQAVDLLRRRDVADLTLLGDPTTILSTASQLGITLPSSPNASDAIGSSGSSIEIIDPANSPLRDEFAREYMKLREHKGITFDMARDRMEEVSYFGTMMVRLGLAGGMVSGSIHTTANTIRPAFEFIKTRPGVNVVSSVFLMCLKHSVLVYGDCAVIPNPTAEQLAEIGSSSADTAAQFGIEPRVAMLSYSTGGSGDGEDVQRVRKATELLRSKRPDLLVEGPLQYDAAIDPEVAATKLPTSKVAGRATVFIFPDLNTGNNTYKAVQRSAGAVAIGPILQGLRKPVNDLSRGCTVSDIVNTVAITAIQAQSVDAPTNDEDER
ncbi:phosphotransacetylase [Neorhodopirellula lusitana]|uniref:Phosphate acetyltransferase n=1 Tax=Neorhodopirellula lusitana TaxID=445327 RepID=A0ABY1PUN9_9BACT|nr:phosphate acetyltransferase [Neorhodopirellula lusitana]SMP47247.1 phosphotransacetylase [Neorhodopirellula lusitana]